MQKSDTVKIIYLQIITFFAYLVCTYINLNVLQEALSSVCIALSAGIIIYAYIKIERGIQSRASWLMFFMGYVSWIIGDILSALYKSQGADPCKSIPVIIAYIGTNAFFMIAIVSFTLICYKK